MPNVSPEFFNLLIQGGFAALFIWLLIRTQARQDAREDRLLGVLDKYAGELQNITKILERIESQLKG